MSKKSRSKRLISRTARPVPGRPPLVVRLWSGFYAWSGLPYAYNDRVGHWLVGLGIITLGVLYLNQITWQAQESYHIQDVRTKAIALRAAVDDLTDQAAQEDTLAATKAYASSYVPVLDVVFTTQ